MNDIKGIRSMAVSTLLQELHWERPVMIDWFVGSRSIMTPKKDPIINPKINT